MMSPPTEWSQSVSTRGLDHHYVLASLLRRDFQLSDLSALNTAFDDGLVRRMEPEIGRPVSWPCGEKLDALAVALQEHELQRGHPGASVIHVRNPVAVFGPKPLEPLVPVRGELLEHDPPGFRRQTQKC